MKKEFLQETNFAEEYEDSGPATEDQKALLKKYQQWALQDDELPAKRDTRQSPGHGF